MRHNTRRRITGDSVRRSFKGSRNRRKPLPRRIPIRLERQKRFQQAEGFRGGDTARIMEPMCCGGNGRKNVVSSKRRATHNRRFQRRLAAGRMGLRSLLLCRMAPPISEKCAKELVLWRLGVKKCTAAFRGRFKFASHVVNLFKQRLLTNRFHFEL